MPEFNPTLEQFTIINHNSDENARILAGPGTGKSSTIVALINRLLERSPALKIKLLTFTRAASAELARRVSAHSAGITLKPSTIHSFSISVLLQNTGAGNILSPLRIADDWETAKIINPTLARRVRVSTRRLGILIKEMAANWESLRPGEDQRVSPEDRARFLGAWNEHRNIYGYTLLSELPFALRASLRDHNDLEGINFDVLICDEYQDLNACDLDVLKLIGQRGCSIIAAGDDDQSIYSFRKAAPEGIRRFCSDYPGAKNYPLSISQRCGRRILDWASYVIEGDPDRPADRQRPICTAGAAEGNVALLSFGGQAAEANGIAKLAQLLIERAAVLPSEILILLRGDYQGNFSKLIKRELDDLSITYSDPNKVNGIIAEPSNRRSVAILRLLMNRVDSIAWASLLKLTHGIGNTFSDSIYETARLGQSQYGQTLLQAYEAGFPDLPAVQARLAQTLLQSVLAWIDAHPIPEEYEGGWGRWIIETSQGGITLVLTEQFKALLLELDRLIESHQSLDRYLGQLSPLGEDIALANSEGVRIMTLGKAKGLTVRATIIGATEEGIIPRPNCNLGEERRLLYVGMTRAKEFLFCTWARRRTGPTARSGAPRVRTMRSHSTFLINGPVESQDGLSYIDHWR
jgi:DNA helicase II / ATP-dependent DNA helicase PcrA